MEVPEVDIIRFHAVQWTTEVPGVALRTIRAPDGNVWNTVEYQPGAVRSDVWCTKGHRGFVLEGEMSYEYRDDGSFFSVRAEEGFIIHPGRAHRGHNRSTSPARFVMIDDAS